MRWLRAIILSGLLALSIGLGSPIGTPQAAAQESKQTIYIVQPGDTLGSIAARYGFPTSDLAKVNGLINPNLIYVGQPIVIPAVTPTASATQSTPRAKST